MGQVTLAPTFDVVTTSAYLPGDSLALTLDGTKRWPDAKRLVRFGMQHCQLAGPGAKAIVAEVAEAVAKVSRELDIFTDFDPQAKEISDRMRTAWTDGVASLRQTTTG
jgi:serine/threonine-protein kinase HipA